MLTPKKVPTSTLSRSAIAGAAVTKIGLKHAGYKVRKAFSAKNSEAKNSQARSMSNLNSMKSKLES